MKLSLKLLAVGGTLVIGLGVVCGALAYRPPNLRIASTDFHARIVSSEADRKHGLSGTNPLGEREAMIFVFPSDDRWGIWMKDMKYPIDILWLDKDRIVRHIVEDARPESYPTTFRPDMPVRYVIEMKSGTAKQKHITIGSGAKFTP